MATIAFMKSISGAVQRTLRRHRIVTAMRPHKTLKQLLVHPKDMEEVKDTAVVVYSIPCTDCPMVYTGEQGRRGRVRMKKNHMKDVEQLVGVKFTWVRKKESINCPIGVEKCQLVRIYKFSPYTKRYCQEY